MQAQYNIASSSCPSSIDYYHSISSAYSTVHDQYFATGGGNFSGSFSRGSSLVYPHEDYRYMTDRGCPSSTTSATALASAPVYASSATSSITFDATGLAFTGNNNSITAASVSGREYGRAEDIPASYRQSQGWQWECHPTTGQANVVPSSHSHPHSLAHPQIHAPVLPQLPGTTGSPVAIPSDHATFLELTSTIKSAVTVGQTQNYHPLCSPTAQLPTPAAMAVLLNPNGHSSRRAQTPQVAMDATAASAGAGLSAQQPPTMIQMPSSVAEATALMSVPDILSREKKHACTMCHKRFDRPSTLRKHLLVHTGEKAFVCETCGRRFGVASNLNRHVRRCILKPVNAVAAAAGTSSSVPPSNGTPSDMSSDRDTSAKGGAPKRGRALSSTGSTSSSSSLPLNPSPAQKVGVDGTVQKPPSQKRRRRAPSPSLWVPWSLRTFNLTCEEFYRSTPVPLPPVQRSLPKEERDSWDENVASRPYHPVEWKGVLPGPGLGHGLGLGGKDVRNINFGGSGGIMLGRVLVY